MNTNDLFDIIGETPEAYVLDAGSVHEKKIQMKRYSPKRIWLIAAVIAAMVFLMGCAIVYALSVKDMAFGSEVQEYYDGSSQEVTLLSLQGIQGTPGYMATKEWYDWLETYDTDGAVWDSHEAYGADFGDEYYAYSIYSQEMKEKLDEICEKYDLELLGKMYVDPDMEAACKALEINGFFRPGVQAEAEFDDIGYYANGSFRLEGLVKLPGYDEHIVTLRCHRKDAFTELYSSIGSEGTYEEWTYATSYGADLLMVIDRGGVRGCAKILCDEDIYTYILTILEFEDMPLPSKEELEAYAEAFDFMVKPQRLTDQQINEVNARCDARWAEIEAEQETKEEEFQEYLGRASYDARVRFHLENDTEATRMGYTFYDFDGNGVEELVIGRDGYIEYIYTEKDGQTAEILGWIKMGDTYLATDGTLVIVSDDTYRFFHVENGERVMDYWVEHRTYWGPTEESPWRLCYSVADDRPITEDEYYEYANSKERVVLDMLPLTEYPLTEPANYNTDGKDITYYNTQTSYEEIIRFYILNPMEIAPGVFDEPKYVLMGLDGDGQEEMIVDEAEYRAVYTMADGKAIPMYSGTTYNGVALNICRGNIIEIVHSYSGNNKVYCYYRMSGTKGEMVEYLRYDAERDPQNPWFRSTDGSGQDISLVPISKVEFDSIRQTYAHIELDWKAVSEYPLN